MTTDLSQQLAERVKAAAETGTALSIMGGATKSFMGRTGAGEPLSIGGHHGVVSYDPTELVITARAGTPLAEIEALLAERQQMLPFEPPHFDGASGRATLGGTIACGLSGPARPYAGAARDFVLGTRIINGRGEVLRFGGEVMKNVAGYDLSRLMAGAMGTLGVMLEISLKVLPRPGAELTLCFERTAARAVEDMNAWAAQPLPLSAACHDGERLYVRLAGAESAVKAAQTRLGGETMVEGGTWWQDLREHAHPFFAEDAPLWRLAVAPATPPLALPGQVFTDWGGGQRWLRSDADAGYIRTAAAQAGGHATLFGGGDRSGDVFHPLSTAMMALHTRVKKALDPAGILNRGRLYAGL